MPVRGPNWDLLNAVRLAASDRGASAAADLGYGLGEWKFLPGKGEGPSRSVLDFVGDTALDLQGKYKNLMEKYPHTGAMFKTDFTGKDAEEQERRRKAWERKEKDRTPINIAVENDLSNWTSPLGEMLDKSEQERKEKERLYGQIHGKPGRFGNRGPSLYRSELEELNKELVDSGAGYTIGGIKGDSTPLPKYFPYGALGKLMFTDQEREDLRPTTTYIDDPKMQFEMDKKTRSGNPILDAVLAKSGYGGLTPAEDMPQIYTDKTGVSTEGVPTQGNLAVGHGMENLQNQVLKYAKDMNMWSYEFEDAIRNKMSEEDLLMTLRSFGNQAGGLQ